MSVIRWSRQSALLVALLVAAPACRSLGPEKPSAVARGEYFSTGNAYYDEFFVRLHRLQVDLHAAPQTLAWARSELIRGLALRASADNQELRATLASRTSAIAARGAYLRIEQPREPQSRVTLVVNGAPHERDRELVKILGAVVVQLEDLRGGVAIWRRELEWLPATGVELDRSVETAFVGKSRGTRDEVHENLADAQKLLALMSQRVKEVDRSRAELLEALGATLAPPPPEPSPPTPPSPKPRAPRPSADSGKAPASREPAARPDFEP